jgi:hypothetical protein
MGLPFTQQMEHLVFIIYVVYVALEHRKQKKYCSKQGFRKPGARRNAFFVHNTFPCVANYFNHKKVHAKG